MADPDVTREAVLRHRIATHQLGEEMVDPATCHVLDIGVRDNPVGATAGLALRARSVDMPPDADDLVRVYSIRSALHAHRRSDLGALRAAIRWSDTNEPAEQTYGPVAATLGAEGLDLTSTSEAVAAAMRDSIAGAARPTKPELSTAVTERVDPAAAPWCPGCEAHHVHDGLFRHSTLLAGLVAVAEPGRSFRMHLVDDHGDDPDPDQARAGLLRRYVQLAGVATKAQFASWLGMQRTTVDRWWALIADELAPVRIDGARVWALAGDVRTLTEPPDSDDAVVRLLPAYDPYGDTAARKLLAPDSDRRRQVWRAVRNPGIVLRGGEIVGVWRDRRAGSGRSVTIEPFGKLTKAQQKSAVDSATRLFAPDPVKATFG